MTDPSSIPPDVAYKLLLIRDAFVREDHDDIWHYLYSIASPGFDEFEPWKKLEQQAEGFEAIGFPILMKD